jgi:hypothetical protein
VAVTVAEPGVVADTREVRIVPLVFAIVSVTWLVIGPPASGSVPPGKVPNVVVNTTSVPMGMGALLVSLSVAVIADEEVPSAGMLAGLAVKRIDPITTAEELTVISTESVTFVSLALVAITVSTPSTVPAV